MKITEIIRKKTYYEVYAGDAVYEIDGELLRQYHIQEGESLDEDTLEELHKKSRFRRAYRRACYLLDDRDYSYCMMYQKLMHTYQDKQLCIKVMEQLDNFKRKIKNPENDGEVADFIRKVLRREEGDGAGLIYGMGHAVYTLSDPRAVLLKEKGLALAKGKDIEEDFRLLETIERLTPALVAEKSARAAAKNICANVDLYSGLVYRMLHIPPELLTPMFAVSRIAGWSAHRIEEVLTGGRIIRPAYKSITKAVPYVPLADRK